METEFGREKETCRRVRAAGVTMPRGLAGWSDIDRHRIDGRRLGSRAAESVPPELPCDYSGHDRREYSKQNERPTETRSTREDDVKTIQDFFFSVS